MQTGLQYTIATHEMNKDTEIINTAKQVIDDEIEALIGLKDYIDSNFEEIVNLIFKCKGRLVFTGIGKSGHISKKISATLSSTGTSSSLCILQKLFTEISE